MRAVWAWIVIVFASMQAVPGSAQVLLTMGSTEGARPWEAVGRLEIGGNAFCTGALISERLVLTAAHCLFDVSTGLQVPVDDIQFLAGWRNGRAAAYRRVRKAVPHPDYDFAGPPTIDRVRRDLALIELQHPIRNTTIAPFDTAPSPGKGDRVGVVSYAHDRSEAPSLQDTCTVVAPQDGMLVLDCSVDFGSSGSPVFRLDGEMPRIVSVISAKAEANGQPVSLAMDLTDPLGKLLEAYASAGDFGVGLDRMLAGTRRETGAKFVKP